MRVIVKNIPLDVSESQIRSHFSKIVVENKPKELVITDIGLPTDKNRAFCFIGLKTQENALDFIKYFNNTYFKTKKISVEICKPKDDYQQKRQKLGILLNQDYEIKGSQAVNSCVIEMHNFPPIATIKDFQKFFPNNLVQCKIIDRKNEISETENESKSVGISRKNDSKNIGISENDRKNEPKSVGISRKNDSKNIGISEKNDSKNLEISENDEKNESKNLGISANDERNEILNTETSENAKKNIGISGKQFDSQNEANPEHTDTPQRIPTTPKIEKLNTPSKKPQTNTTEHPRAMKKPSLTEKVCILTFKDLESSLKAQKRKVFMGKNIFYKKHEAQDEVEFFKTLFFDFTTIIERVCGEHNLKKEDLLDLKDQELGSRISVLEAHMVDQTTKWLLRNGINLFPSQKEQESDNKHLLESNNSLSGCKDRETARQDEGSNYHTYDENHQTNNSLSGFQDRELVRQNGVADHHAEDKNHQTNNSSLSGPQDKEGPTKSADHQNPYKDGCVLLIRNFELLSNLEGLESAEVQISPSKCLALAFFKTKKDGHTAYKKFALKRIRDKAIYCDFIPEHLINFDLKAVDQKTSQTGSENDDTKNFKTTKVIVKNVPFQASTNDIRNILKTKVNIVNIKMPQKRDKQSRGFCFVELESKSDVRLVCDYFGKSTHLYGRRLIFQPAEH